jgi:hypothetical protein
MRAVRCSAGFYNATVFAGKFLRGAASRASNSPTVCRRAASTMLIAASKACGHEPEPSICVEAGAVRIDPANVPALGIDRHEVIGLAGACGAIQPGGGLRDFLHARLLTSGAPKRVTWCESCRRPMVYAEILDGGWIDGVRRIHPKKGVYTHWNFSYRGGTIGVLACEWTTSW